MTTPTLARRAAEAIVRVTAQWLRPTRRREWGSAMRAELAHIEDDHEALRFAYGCAVAAITLRSTTMHFGTLKVSRFVLALEMALCFVPMTFGWLDFVFGASGVAWLDAAAVERYYLGTAEGVAAFAKLVAGALIGILGPLGLIVALRHIALGRTLRRGWLAATLLVGPAVLGVVYMAANLASDTRFWPDWAGFYVLFVALPVGGAAHLLLLGRAAVHARADPA
jgi:hypothetical protein